MYLIWPAFKDPNEVKDYAVRFGPLLNPTKAATPTDTLATIVSVTVVDGDVVVDSSAISTDSEYGVTQNVTIWFSGGTNGETCEVLTRVTTAGGRTYDQTCKLRVRNK